MLKENLTLFKLTLPGKFITWFLFHRAYEPGTACFDSILEALGSDLKAENGQIDRRKLGAKVFANPELLRKLESIVWPEILRMAMEDLKKLHEKEGKSVIILDAAVLLQGMPLSIIIKDVLR